jgi:hypothetical protein
VVELDRVGSVGYLFSFLSMVILHILIIPREYRIIGRGHKLAYGRGKLKR